EASIRRIQGLLYMKILEDIKRGPYSKKSSIHQAETNSTTLTAKLHILNPRDYDLWLERTVRNLNATTVKEKQDKGMRKLRGTLLMEIETISLDDLYNNLKIYKPKISGSSSTSQNPQNVAFVSSNSTNSNNSTNEADNTAYGVTSQPNSPQLAQEDLEQTDPDDLEEMDLQ
ncbi:hypothetical protein Tco_0711950, partial [Tanacetum coccineum]